VARGTQHRKRRPAPNARVAAQAPAPKAKAKPQHASWEEQLFFSRLRVHAKWMFVFLALVFGVGFVIFGVGSGSTGIGDVLQNFFRGSSSSGSSLSSLQKKTVEHPKDPKAWRDLATKLEQKNKPDEAITALAQYTTLRPKDASALQELAGLYIRRAGDYQVIYQEAAVKAQTLMPTSPFQPKSSSPLGKALSALGNPIQTAVQQQTSSATTDAYSKLVQNGNSAVATYKKLAALSPKDATTQFRLAQVAQGMGDTATARAAYKKFLVLAPDDPLAASARKALKQLK
jgi:tetratricopeptide (TPR) repeat protein